MADGRAKVFSLAQANELVPTISELTGGIVEKLNQIRRQYKIESENQTASMPESALKGIEQHLREWSDRISELGAHPKGYFTVDFQSVDPELLYCWTYGEDKIAFTHKVWENFSHRRPLAASLEHAMDHMKWVH